MTTVIEAVSADPEIAVEEAPTVIAVVDLQALPVVGEGAGGPPSGPAGGVLAGLYPNPSFAVDMATQAGLDAEAATRAAADTTNATALATEATTRAAADTSLSNAITTEASTRAAADTAEAAARDTAIGTAIAALINSAPGVLDTLAEIATALSNDPNFAATMTTALAGKQPLDADLTAIAALNPADDAIVQRASGIWVAHTPAQVKATLALAKGDVGLGNVDNTADASKPVSTAQAAADVAVQAFAIARANHTGTQSADTLTDGTTNKAFLATERTKLAGIATGATANSSDATLLARANHTGTQLLATISDAGSLAALNTVGTAQIDNDAVTNAKLANIATQTIKGRTTSGTGDPEDLTAAQSRAVLGLTATSAFLLPTGVIAETVPRVLVNTNGSVLSTGAVSHYPIYLRAGDVITTITFYSGGTGAGTPTNYWFALCDSSFVTIRSTADQLTAAWAASTAKALALSSQVTIATTGWYNVSIMVKATTVPTLATTTGVLSPPIAQITPTLGLNGSIAQTVPVADGTNLTGANTAKTSVAYAYVS